MEIGKKQEGNEGKGKLNGKTESNATVYGVPTKGKSSKSTNREKKRREIHNGGYIREILNGA